MEHYHVTWNGHSGGVPLDEEPAPGTPIEVAGTHLIVDEVVDGADGSRVIMASRAPADG